MLPQGGQAELWPIDVRVGVANDRLFVKPLRPLPEATRVAVFATQTLATATTSGCVAPSEGMRRTLRLPDPQRASAIQALVDLGVVSGWEDLVALHVVTTQTATRDSVAIARHIESLSPRLMVRSCQSQDGVRTCEAALAVEDYRGADGTIPDQGDGLPVSPSRTWDVPVSIWLPDDGASGSPYPTVVFGHGLAGERSSAEARGRLLAAEGYATVATDAVLHGEHPSALDQAPGSITSLLGFFAVDLEAQSIDAIQLRDHFRQTAFDRLQLVRALVANGDLDGDDVLDVDVDRLGYLGISLGGIMANQLAALTPHLSVVVNYVGGGSVASIVSDPDSQYGGLLRSFLLPRLDEDQVSMGFAGLQTALEAGDASVFGAHLLSDRFADMGTSPDYLFGVAIGDTTVPNASSYSLARALGIPVAGTVVDPQPGLAAAPEMTPFAGNLTGEGGAFTAGLLQYDLIDNEGTPAGHSLGSQEIGIAAWLPFVRAHFEEGMATLVDPYVTEGVSHAP